MNYTVFTVDQNILKGFCLSGFVLMPLKCATAMEYFNRFFHQEFEKLNKQLIFTGIDICRYN